MDTTNKPPLRAFDPAMVLAGRAEVQIGLQPTVRANPLSRRKVGSRLLDMYQHAEDIDSVSLEDRLRCLQTAGQLLVMGRSEIGAIEASAEIQQLLNGLSADELATLPEEIVDPDMRLDVFAFPERTIWARRGWSS